MNGSRIAKIIKDIDRFFKDLGELEIQSVRDLEGKERFYAASMLLFSIINRAIDLGEEVVADKKLGFPEKYREIFMLLKNEGIIDTKLSKHLSDLVYFRNLAAHEYHTFTKEDVFKAFQRVHVVNRFVDIVKKLFKS